VIKGNISHFNESASQWDSESKIEMMRLLAKKTMNVLHLTEPLDIMDFGCGTGLYGLEFSAHAKTLLGVDTSPGMLEAFDKKTEGSSKISSQLIDLEKEDLDLKFDLILSSMAFHHLSQPSEMISKMKTMLKRGGRLAIVDLDEEDGTFHPDNKGMGVKHFGFNKGQLSQWASEAHMNLHHEIINSIEKEGRVYRQFLAIFS